MAEKLGVIDLGSNSVRLVVYEVENSLLRRAKKVKGVENFEVSKKDFDILLDAKKIAGLSAYVQDGVFSDEGIARAAYILKRHLQRAKNAGCNKVKIFATAVIRNCTNSGTVVAALEKQVGRKIHLLSGEDEAYLDFLGARCERKMSAGTLIDIGGGSTELVSIKDGQAQRCISLDQGSVSSYAQFVSVILPTSKEFAAISKALQGRLKQLPDLEEFQSEKLYGVGGSVRAIAKICGAMKGEFKVPRAIEAADVAALGALLKSDRDGFAHLAARVVPDRLHTLGCGIAMVSQLLDTLGGERIEVCRFGVREGFLITNMIL